VQIRVGLNAGALVARAIDSNLHMDYTEVGQTTYLAALLEQMAKPDSVLTTGETMRLAEGFVQVKALGPVALNGPADSTERVQIGHGNHCHTTATGWPRRTCPNPRGVLGNTLGWRRQHRTLSTTRTLEVPRLHGS
jgi:hypothetical protein